jgi:hypothetical protein
MCSRFFNCEQIKYFNTDYKHFYSDASLSILLNNSLNVKKVIINDLKQEGTYYLDYFQKLFIFCSGTIPSVKIRPDFQAFSKINIKAAYKSGTDFFSDLHHPVPDIILRCGSGS